MRVRLFTLLAPGLALALVLAAATIWSAPHWLLDRVAARFPGCRFYARTQVRAVALTIDDGPDASTTPALLRLLARYDAAATFFVISERLQGNEALVAAMVREGHELGNHLTRDVPSIALEPTAFERAVTAADEAIREYGPPRWLRPGSGWYSARIVRALERQGYQCALGSVYPFDATLASPSFAALYILRNVRPGSIIVLHDGGERGRRTLQTLARVLPELQERGYAVLTLTALTALEGSR